MLTVPVSLRSFQISEVVDVGNENDKITPASGKRAGLSRMEKRIANLGNILADAIMPRDVAICRQADRQNRSVLPERVYPLSEIVSGGHFGRYNVVISGGNQLTRSTAERLIVDRAMSRGVAVVIIHCGNLCFTQQYKTSVYIPERGYGLYSPLSSLSPIDAALLLTKVGTSTLNIPNIFGFWKLATELASLEDGKVSLKNLIALPLFDLPEYILSHDKILPDRQMEFVNLYNRVAEKVDDAQLVLSEIGDLPIDNPLNYPNYSISDVVNGGGLVSIDIVSDSNRLYKELCFAELEQLMRGGQRFVLVLENIKLVCRENSYTDKVLLDNNNNITLVYGSDDVHVAAQAKPELFHSLVGGASSAIVMRHNSSQSAMQWEDFFGKYYHTSV